MQLRSAIFAAIVLASSVGGAQAQNCGAINSYKDIIQCADLRAPEIRQAQADAVAGQARVQAAGQWTNPDFSLQTLTGRHSGQTNSETDLALVFPLDISGRRSSNQAFANGEAGVLQAGVGIARHSSRTQTLIQLHRLRQLVRSRELVSESIQTFSKLVKIYEGRPQLTPEQQVSLALFRMAKSDYLLKLSSSDGELAELESWFRKTTSLEFSVVQKNLPPEPRRWPEVSAAESTAGSLESVQAQAEADKARAELQLAQAEVWPALNLGPAVKLLDDGGEKSQLYGVNLSFPIPVFNANGAGKSAANSRLKSAELKSELIKFSERLERESLVKDYKSSVAALKDVVTSLELEKKHGNIEQLFLRGLVSGALVIEAHRSLVDLERSRAETEIRAIGILARIHFLDGVNAEVNL